MQSFNSDQKHEQISSNLEPMPDGTESDVDYDSDVDLHEVIPVTKAEIAAAIALLPCILPADYVERRQLERCLEVEIVNKNYS